ncbi:hypothetical protein SAMN05216486_10287 [bacterium JGI 053]|nr:hypothetical protein SAMN05216486_10287 [bacterium JGI 053]
MKILCPSCRVPVAAEDIALDTGLAKCRTCNNVFRFADDPALTARPRPVVGKPRSVVTSDAGVALTVDYRWFSPKYILMVFFCLFWDGFLVFWYAMAAADRNVIGLLFPILHVAVGIAATYATIAGLVNTTTLRIDGYRLRVTHHPLPWVRGVDLGIGDVQQLFCDERIIRGRYGASYAYDLNALLRDGSRRKVLANLDTPELPLYLEQHAEEWMGIQDEPVAGELTR